MTDISQQAQIISPVHDPMKNGFSPSRIVAMAITIFAISIELAFFFATYPKIISWIIAFLFCLTVCIYLAFLRDEQTLSYNINKIGFQRRQKKGSEGMGKYDDKTTEKQVKSYIPWNGINEKTGLSSYEYPNAREYFGNWGFDVMAIPPAEVDKDTMNEKFRRVFRALPKGSSQKIILMTGIDPSFMLNDIEEMLKQPGLSPSRLAELRSMQEKFSNQRGAIDRTYLIHINLPYTAHEEKAQANMNRIMNGYIRLLNRMKIKTILIREEDDMILIFQGMLTGKKLYGVV
jgi:hypothetical protein